MEDLEIRLASVADYGAVVELSRATYEDKADEDHDYIPNRFHGWLSERKRAVFVAEMDEKIVGYGVLWLLMVTKALHAM